VTVLDPASAHRLAFSSGPRNPGHDALGRAAQASSCCHSPTA
jgi:hypothetical protein